MMTGNPFLTIRQNGATRIFKYFSNQGPPKEDLGDFITHLPRSLDQNPFPTISLRCFHDLPTTKNTSTLSANGYQKDC